MNDFEQFVAAVEKGDKLKAWITLRKISYRIYSEQSSPDIKSITIFLNAAEDLYCKLDRSDESLAREVLYVLKLLAKSRVWAKTLCDIYDKYTNISARYRELVSS